ncbi:SOS response-associated peptidase [Lutibaculum baratangense]|uniref:Abasic site processing protein n=1 Tax=Lutibaculum baratangense AMV1 TaxID=631454 RepID=V4QYC3_9HYPH|nr:SOS response-associated peptidase [Lutibaculum baratangense]ESR24757.1 Gifsy-2 prophage protein [Lutibaculum baratangense AMV1]
MCGRYSLTLPPEAVRRFFAFREQPNFPPRYNIAPTQPIPVVRLDHQGRSFILMRWGLLPSWLEKPGGFPTLCNARAESVAEKAAFRNAFRRRRCLIPADGFYEWRKVGKGPKVPHFIHRADRGPFAFAGVWETWIEPEGGEIDTAAILTTTANDTLRPLHDRMPVVLQPEDWDRWLAQDADRTDHVRDLLRPAPNEFFVAEPISTRVNAVANDDAAIQEPVAEDALPAATPDGSGSEPGPRQMDLF